jgi:hypothetical protein
VRDNGLPLDLRLEADGAMSATIQMTVVGQRVMEIHGAAVEIDHLTLTGGSTADFGGGILNNGGDLTLTRVQLRNNSANAGGGLYNDNGAVLVSENSQIILNQGALGGGGISNTGDLIIRNSIIRANGSSGGSGGGVYSGGGTLLVEANSAINLNSAAFDGGGLFLINNIVSARIDNSVVQGNTADNDGGGIHFHSLASNKLAIEKSQIADNSAGGAGGGFWGTGRLTGTRVNDNDAANVGGGLYTHGTLYLNDMQIDGNTAVFGGGMGGGSAIGARLQIYNNQASQRGGGSYISYFELQDSWIGGNSAGVAGGGIYTENHIFTNMTATLERVLLDSNSAPNGGNIWTDRRLALGNVTITRQDVKAKTEELGMDSTGIMGGDPWQGEGLYIDVSGIVTATNVTLALDTFENILYKAGELTLQNSIINNNNLDQTNCLLIATPINSLGHNISNDNSCAGLNQPTDMVNTNPKLGWLGDNGGFTQTRVLLPGSPALDAGNAAGCAGPLVNGVDQRGIPRPIGGGCDIGAFEFGFALYLPLTQR